MLRPAMSSALRAAIRLAVLRGRPIWTPAALFAQGQQGAWYEPKPQYLFQDAAGTVPVTADGDPVGLELDVSGNGHNGVQSISSMRPVYDSGALVTDGIDDSIFCDNIGYSGERFRLLAAAFKVLSIADYGASEIHNKGIILISSKVSGSPLIGTSINEYGDVIIGSDSNYFNYGANPVGVTLAVCIEVDTTDGSIRVWLNGNEVSNFSAGSELISTFFSTEATTGGRTESPSSPFSSNVSIGPRILQHQSSAYTSHQIDAVNAYLAGVTL